MPTDSTAWSSKLPPDHAI